MEDLVARLHRATGPAERTETESGVELASVVAAMSDADPLEIGAALDAALLLLSGSGAPLRVAARLVERNVLVPVLALLRSSDSELAEAASELLHSLLLCAARGAAGSTAPGGARAWAMLLALRRRGDDARGWCAVRFFERSAHHPDGISVVDVETARGWRRLLFFGPWGLEDCAFVESDRRLPTSNSSVVGADDIGGGYRQELLRLVPREDGLLPILVVGFGGGTMVRALSRLGLVVDAVEIDPAVIRASHAFEAPRPLSGGAVRVHAAEASEWCCTRAASGADEFRSAIVDLFTDAQLAPACLGAGLWTSLAHLVVPGGQVGVNAGPRREDADAVGAAMLPYFVRGVSVSHHSEGFVVVGCV